MPRRYSAKKGGRNKSRRLRGGSVDKAKASFTEALEGLKEAAAHASDGLGHSVSAARKASTTATKGATATLTPGAPKKDKNGKPMGDKDQFNFNSSAVTAPTSPSMTTAPTSPSMTTAPTSSSDFKFTGGRKTKRRRGGRGRRGGRRRTFRGGSGKGNGQPHKANGPPPDSSNGTSETYDDGAGGTYDDIINDGNSGPHQEGTTDINNSSSGNSSSSSSAPSGDAWDSKLLGPFGGKSPSWEAFQSGGRRRKGGKYHHPHKGQMSRTMKRKKDFTTKKGNKKYNRRGHRQTRNAKGRKGKPYMKGGGCGCGASMLPF